MQTHDARCLRLASNRASAAIVISEVSNPALGPPPTPDSADAWALFLDVDGTLLDFAGSPGAVYVPAALIGILESLRSASAGALALVSGRSVAAVDGLFGHPEWPVAGLHGLERRDADGCIHAHALDAAVAADMRTAAAATVTSLPGARVEDKGGGCVALHCREAPQHQAALAAAAESLAQRFHGYELLRGSFVFELKPIGFDKGNAVCQFVREAPFRGRVPVYLGDDLTDEDAFVAVNALDGFSVRVGQRLPTQARFALAGVGEVHVWLRGCLKVFAARADRKPESQQAGKPEDVIVKRPGKGSWAV